MYFLNIGNLVEEHKGYESYLAGARAVSIETVVALAVTAAWQLRTARTLYTTANNVADRMQKMHENLQTIE